MHELVQQELNLFLDRAFFILVPFLIRSHFFEQGLHLLIPILSPGWKALIKLLFHIFNRQLRVTDNLDPL